ncbi:MAG: hypothetical protein E6K32_17235 [Gammaproteobacteria bacterium]|nr:MAG: hypothetical protein E6K32_17235 [Gammaproteobacteria bacterium]
MVRTLILGLLLLAAARGAAADEAATAPSTPAAAASAPATTRSVDATKQGKAAPAAAASQAAQPGGDVKMSGISILGNEDAPKSLVLVPWKSSQLADMPGVSRLLDSATQPVDKDVFMRELAYYEFKSSSK